MSRTDHLISRRGTIALTAFALMVAASVPTAMSATAEPPTPTREETVIFDIALGRVPDPELGNPFLPASRVDVGYVQAMI